MYDIEDSFDRQIFSYHLDRPTVIFTEPWDSRVVEGACNLARFARPVFLASEKAVKKVLAKSLSHVDPNRVEFALSESAFVDIGERTDLIEEFAQEWMEVGDSQGKVKSLDDARIMVSEPGRFGIFATPKNRR